MIDEFVAQYPEISVARLRPALIFQADAGSEIQRYFLNAWLPMGALRRGVLPALPLPSGFRGVQAVHGEDLGRAYAAAVVAKKSGAFNICADDVLTPKSLAEVLDHGRVVSVPARLMRGGLKLAHAAGAAKADHGWFDMGMHDEAGRAA